MGVSLLLATLLVWAPACRSGEIAGKKHLSKKSADPEHQESDQPCDPSQDDGCSSDSGSSSDDDSSPDPAAMGTALGAISAGTAALGQAAQTISNVKGAPLDAETARKKAEADKKLAEARAAAQRAAQQGDLPAPPVVTSGGQVRASAPASAPAPSGPATGSSAAIKPPEGDAFDRRKAIMEDCPADLADWPAAANLTLVQFTPGQLTVDFDKRTGAGRWPDVTPAGWGGPLQYTLGLCEKISGTWYCSAAIQYWYGRDLPVTTEIARNWFYDGRWGPLAGRQPASGEMVGVFVGAGNLRNVRDASQSPAKQRSNVALVRWP